MMKIFNLTKLQKNDLLDLITDVGLNPQLFTENVRSNTEVGPIEFVLSVKDASYFFQLETSPQNLIRATMIPGPRLFQESKDVMHWGEVQPVFSEWLQRVKDNIQAPDLWEEFSRSVAMPDLSIGSVPDVSFTVRELATVSKVLDIVKSQYMSFAHGDSKKIAQLEERVAFLEKQAQTQSKRGWWYMFIGVFTELVTSFALSTESAAGIGMAIQQALVGIFPLLGKKPSDDE